MHRILADMNPVEAMELLLKQLGQAQDERRLPAQRHPYLSGGGAVPIHDWKKAPVGLYHHFHQSWACELCNCLNAGLLPAKHFALVDQREGRAITGVRLTPPQSDREVYAARANRVAVRNPFGEVVTSSSWCRPATRTASTRSRRSWTRPSSSSPAG
jgi:hypothetical protein